MRRDIGKEFAVSNFFLKKNFSGLFHSQNKIIIYQRIKEYVHMLIVFSMISSWPLGQ